MSTATLIAILLYFVVMLAVGIYAWRHSTDSIAGYLLGGRQLSPAVMALSAGASDMSAWILMGLPGAMYVSGLASSWIAIGLTLGAYCNYRLVAPRLRVYTEVANDAITLPDFFENRFHDDSHLLRIIASVVIVVFFTLYTSSGMVAGGVLFENSFGLSFQLGIAVTAGVVLSYTFLGGFFAVCITDFIQGCLMFLALVIVPLVVLTDIGGLRVMQETVLAVNSASLNLFSGVALTAIISNLAWGLGYFGQPHIIVRFMAIRSVIEFRAARRIGMSWMIVSIIGALATGLTGLAYMRINNIALDDPETVFIVLTQILFHPFIGGILLAAILAAVMSTISSQLLVSSSSLSEDIYRTFIRPEATQGELVAISRVAVVGVAGFAAWLALDRDSTILSLVSNAWAGFGAAFGPLILFSLFWARMTRAGALAGIVVGASTVLIWIYAPFTLFGQAPGSVLYEIIPGFLLSSLAIVGVSLYRPVRNVGMAEEFAEMETRLLQQA